jgi:outer membrane biosynthesis protein TonB
MAVRENKMRSMQRLTAAVVLIAFSGLLGGCASSSFDPSDLLDFLDTKKKLPGDRKPVFPEGVPGLEQGVPKDLYKGAQEQQNADAAAAAVAPPPEPAKPAKSKPAKPKKPSTANAAPADMPVAEPDGEAVQDQPAAPPKQKKIVRKRTTAPPPDQTEPAQSSTRRQPGSQFQAPLPSGGFSR